MNMWICRMCWDAKISTLGDGDPKTGSTSAIANEKGAAFHGGPAENSSDKGSA